MNKRLSRWLYRKAAEAIGQEELESLKKDLIEPVKIAARDAVADRLKEKEEEEERIRTSRLYGGKESREETLCLFPT